MQFIIKALLIAIDFRIHVEYFQIKVPVQQ